MKAEIEATLCRAVETVEPGLYSALPDTRGAPYDSKAKAYDLLVGSRAYNRLIWNTARDWYGEVAKRAAASGSGPLLEGGCGTALFTRDAWSDTDRPLLLLDRSLDMLRVAQTRVDGDTFLQGDLFDLPVEEGAFETVCSFGVMHVLDDVETPIRQLWSAVAPGGQLWITSIVDAGYVPAKAWYAALQLAGEVAPARTPDELAAIIEGVTGVAPEVEVEGSFALFVSRR